MAKQRDGISRLVVRKNATLREIYAKAREQFTADDLQKFTEIEEGIPVEQIIAKMETIQRSSPTKRAKKT